MNFDLGAVRAFLLDMDGTIYLGDRLLPGAQEFLTRLKETNRPYLFFTNNSSRDAAEYAEKLTRLGVATQPEQVLTSGQATVDYLTRQLAAQKVFALGTPSFEREIVAGGLALVEQGAQPSAGRPDAVVLGFDMTLTYDKVRWACHWILEGVPFVASHPDLVCPTPAGPIPDCGAMTAMITAATGVEPRVIGKPYPAMAQAGLHRLGVVPQDTAIVGDRLYTDMAMGHQAGLHTILVLSGEATQADVDQAHPAPDLVVPGVGQLIAGL